MNTRRRFTEEEDRLILSKIGENPNNIAQCLRELSIELDRSFYTLQTRWYKTLAKKNMNNKTNTRFMIYGRRSVNPNRKIAREGTQQPTEIRRSKWRRILDIIFE